jgi:cell division protein FtsB
MRSIPSRWSESLFKWLTDMLKSLRIFPIYLVAAVCVTQAQTVEGNIAIEKLLERITLQEQNAVQKLRSRSAVLETYIQELSDDPNAAEQGERDHYFLGRLELAKGLNYVPLVARSELSKGSRLGFLKARASVFLPSGFAQMVMPDGDNFTARNYRFDYVHREFLGEVRCLVFDVSPIDQKAVGKFIGRIWVEDREMNIVRFNGTYTHSSAAHLYFHFDSWRVNAGPGEWVPAFIYVEESKRSATAPKFPRFKAQTRLWGYNIPKNGRLEELTSIAIETESDVKDSGKAAESTPLESQRAWERQAEANIIDRLEKSGRFQWGRRS